LYQIVWVRTLVLVIGSSTYAISSILVTFLLGIALGSFVFSKLHSRNGLRFFALLQFGIGACAFLLLPMFNRLPEVFFSLFKSFDQTFRYVPFLQFLVVAAVVLLPTTLMGMTFPSVAGMVTRNMGQFGGDLGRIYAWNTVGAIAGAVLTGFFLIPAMGAQNTLLLGILGNLAVGATIFLRSVSSGKKATAWITVLLCAALALYPRWDRRAMSSGVFYLMGESRHYHDLTTKRLDEILFLREGITSTIAVARDRSGVVGLLVNGKVDASNGDDMETQVNLATVPILLHPEPRRIAVIGLGIGVTAGTAALFRIPEKIDVVEIEPAVGEASQFFRKENHEVLEDPRVRVRFEDGRNFIEEAEDPYDVIISEPSNPWMKGVADLYTREFFREARNRLSPDGIYCQWVQGYSISPDDLKMIARTFLSIFPEATLWLASEGDLMFLGRKDVAPTTTVRSIIERAEKNPRLVDAYRPFGESPADGLFANFLLGPEELREFGGDGPVHTDDLPLLEFSAPKSLYLPAGTADNRKEIFRRKTGDFPEFLVIPTADLPGVYWRIGKYLLDHDRAAEANRAFAKASVLGLPVPVRRSLPADSIRPVPPSVDILETFDDKDRRVPVIPYLGGFRPEETDKTGFTIWSANMDHFSDVSGVVPGVGFGGSAALTVRSIPEIASVGYYIPLAVRPSTTYRVKFRMKSQLSIGGEAGAGIAEYDAILPLRAEPTLPVVREHRIGSKAYIRVPGEHGWEEYAFAFTSSKRARMVHLLFFREGLHTREPVVFDDIEIRKIR